ncbi:MAG: exonuclease domain-containing protein [Gemmatimonadota bacterium]|nr:exonuclease domain-containing protein [Gemmatimonadota bacterium]
MELRALPRETLLTSRALELLAAGPADAVALIEHVCNLPGAPRAVAEHMAEALFASRAEFAREPGGRWLLVAHAPPPSGASIALVPRGLDTLTYAVVDVETTGSRPWDGDRVTEIAAIVVRDGQVVDRFESLVNPQRPIPPMISALTNISWDMVKHAPTFRDVCDRVLAVLEGRVFVAHNAEFDWRFVSAETSRATGRRLVGQRLCTVRLARLLLPQLRSRRLDAVADHYGIEIEARHRAGGDAFATAHVLLRLLADARCRDCLSWEDLQRLLRARASRARRGRRASAMPGPVDRDTTA